MSNHIDFYFDIISPYAYIAHKKILKHKNIIFNYKPVYLGGLHKLAGIDSPAFNKYKLKNNINDCNLVSEKNNIVYKAIKSFKSTYNLSSSFEIIINKPPIIAKFFKKIVNCIPSSIIW